LRARDKIEISMIRTLIAAIENAEAIDADDRGMPAIGFNHDQPRKTLTADDVTRIVVSERDDLIDALEQYRSLGLGPEVEELEHRVEIVDRYLVASPG
jgi:hypothetical protein